MNVRPLALLAVLVLAFAATGAVPPKAGPGLGLQAPSSLDTNGAFRR